MATLPSRRFCLLASAIVLFILEAEGCRVGNWSECEKVPFVPGHNLAGEGFDVVRMRRTGAYVINVKDHLSANRTCTLCPNRFHAGQVRGKKLPKTATTPGKWQSSPAAIIIVCIAFSINLHNLAFNSFISCLFLWNVLNLLLTFLPLPLLHFPIPIHPLP